jgi:hypothetical protein
MYLSSGYPEENAPSSLLFIEKRNRRCKVAPPIGLELKTNGGISRKTPLFLGAM